MDENQETLDSSNGEQETDNSSNVEQVQDVEQEADKPEYTEREKQYYARIKKLEQELKEAKVALPPAATANLSIAETIALSNAFNKANVEPEDIEDILDYAKFKNMSVLDALKSPVMKATLAEKGELRKSAAAVATGAGRRAGSGAISDDRLMADAQRGILPENEADMARLQELRFKGRK